ncbi:hypothetical protein DPEC_G00097010 [Dallia pectoralis]|uniref:Uncharacterized protein n=1 Tax=Dallia pectoralis TaxID=75939 RepID=A0ACC2GVQ4_DALPE|nr:hypothetical protein DPEC_G00097010 [Dallia pectoralis]
MTDHTYSMDTLHMAGGDGDIEEEMDEMQHLAKRDRINKDHTPIKQQQLKKMKPKRLRESVDTVHRLGRRGDAASANYIPRPIIIQFGMRIVSDDVWKKSREARVCREMHIRFTEDFSKDDREARAKLWLRIQEARKAGKRAFLKEGYALIDNKRVDPD